MTDKQFNHPTDTPAAGEPHAGRSDADKSASELAEETRRAAEQRAETLRDKAEHAARDAIEMGKAEAQSRAQQAKASAAGEARRTADAVRAAADRFDEGDFRAEAARQLADGLGAIADRIRDKDLGDIPGDLTRFARQNPTLFFAGAAVLGFTLARLAKASEHRAHAEEFDSFDELPAPYTGSGTSPQGYGGNY